MMAVIAVVALLMACLTIASRSPNPSLRMILRKFVVIMVVYSGLQALSERGRQAWLRHQATGRQAPEQPADPSGEAEEV
jgi:hypothetical protein